MTYNNVRKAGRCFNGFERDGGRIIHIVEGDKPNGDWFDKAMCGTKPGYRGNGWSSSSREATCPKCLKKLADKQHH